LTRLFLNRAEQTVPDSQIKGFVPTEYEPFTRIPLASPWRLPGWVSRSRTRATSIMPIGPGRCLVERSDLTPPSCKKQPIHNQPQETWHLEAWHMSDWMVSVQFSSTGGKRIRHHWLKQGLHQDTWYQLRRCLIWSGRRVEAIGQRESKTGINLQCSEERRSHNP
jgi:hypothetical protein